MRRFLSRPQSGRSSSTGWDGSPSRPNSRWLLFSLVLVVFSWSGSVRADGLEADTFASGNALYAQGKFIEAAQAYETQVQRGDSRANLYYNLGDAYFRAGDRGRAILNYQRALLLDPSHAEAAANLAFLRGKTLPPSARGGFAGWLDVDRWTWLAAAGGWLAILGFGLTVFLRRLRWSSLAVGLTGAAACGVSVWALVVLDGGTKNPGRAVVLADDTRALYSPADNSKAVLTLPAGSEVRVLSEQGAWDYVELGDGARGWVSAARIEKVLPPLARRG